MIPLMYLSVVMLSKLLKTSNELDWDWFCEAKLNFLKNVQDHEFFRNSFLSRKKGGVRVVYYLWFKKLVWMVFMSFSMVLLWKLEFFWKNDKMRRTYWNFRINRNWPRKWICICYCDYMWLVYMLCWGVWTCMLCFWWIS